MGKTRNTVVSRKDTTVSEEFLCKFKKELAVSLKGTDCKTLESLDITTDHLLESQGQHNFGNTRTTKDKEKKA